MHFKRKKEEELRVPPIDPINIYCLEPFSKHYNDNYSPEKILELLHEGIPIVIHNKNLNYLRAYYVQNNIGYTYYLIAHRDKLIIDGDYRISYTLYRKPELIINETKLRPILENNLQFDLMNSDVYILTDDIDKIQEISNRIQPKNIIEPFIYKGYFQFPEDSYDNYTYNYMNECDYNF